MKVGRGSILTTSPRHGAPLQRAYFTGVKTGWSAPNAQANWQRNQAIIQKQQARSAAFAKARSRF